MGNREIVIELLNRLPEDAPLEEIAREIELLSGVRRAREQALRREGVPAENARRLGESGVVSRPDWRDFIVAQLP